MYFSKIRELDDTISDRATNDDFLGQLENASGSIRCDWTRIRGAEKNI
jgi:hypothetical protein